MDPPLVEQALSNDAAVDELEKNIDADEVLPMQGDSMVVQAKDEEDHEKQALLAKVEMLEARLAEADEARLAEATKMDKIEAQLEALVLKVEGSKDDETESSMSLLATFKEVPPRPAGGRRSLMTTAAAQHRLSRRFMSSLFGFEEEEEETDQELHEDTYSFILVAPLCGYSFNLGFLVFLIQEVVFFLLLWSLTDVGVDAKKSQFIPEDASNVFGIPVNVDPEVRILQFVAVAFTVITQTDVIKGLDLMRLVSNSSFREAFPHIKTWRVVLCICCLLLEGTVGVIVSFMLIVTSDNVVDLLLNFTAMAFVSELDEAIFFVTQHGFFGVTCELDAAAVKEITYKVHQKAHRMREIIGLIVLFLGLVSGWAAVVHNQNQGTYQCSTLLVQMGDDISPALGTFSGLYDLKKQERSGILATHHTVYVERKSGRASFGYCTDIAAWTFRWHDTGEPGEDPCNWVAMSSETASYDITDSADSTWYAQDAQSRVVVLDPFYLECYHCEEACNNHGSCLNGICHCEDGYFGLHCEFLAPCPTLEIDARKDGFISTRHWSDNYEQLLFESTSAVEDSGSTSAVATGLIPLHVYHRPVYFNGNEDGTSDLIFFTGRRWVVTSSDSLMEKPQGGRAELTSYFQEDFHAHWSNYSISFLSEPVDIATPGDASSPIDLVFFQAIAIQDGGKTEIQAPDKIESDARLLCAVCNNKTNPCAYDGQCTGEGSCFCPMSRGSLCEVPPVGNGFCNSYYNTPEFNWDGGDCCSQTCKPGEEYACGMDTTGYGSLGYHNCKAFPPNKWVLDEMSWTGYDAMALSDDGEFLVVSSSQEGKTYAFDKAGKDWVQRGDVVLVGPDKANKDDPAMLGIISLSPGMVSSSKSKPPYLVTVPDLVDDSEDRWDILEKPQIKILYCEETCKIVDIWDEPLFTESRLYAVSSNAPYVVLQNETTGYDHLLAYSLDDPEKPYNFATLNATFPVNSVSLSADANTLAVQTTVDSDIEPPAYAVTVYYYNWTSEQYEQRSSPFEFNGTTGSDGSSSPVVLSGDGTTVAFSEAVRLEENGLMSRVQVHAWSTERWTWTELGPFPLKTNYSEPGGSGASALSQDGTTMLYWSGASASVYKWLSRGWSLIDRPLFSLVDGPVSVQSLGMSQDAAVVAMLLGDDSGAQNVQVASIPVQECSEGMSMLRTSVTTDKQPQTKSWTLQETDSGKVLFERALDPGITYNPTATYASQRCIDHNSCHVLTLYAHNNDMFRPPSGYSVTVDGLQVSKRAEETKFHTRRVFVGNCLSCEPGMKLFRFLLTTCETMASWELVDSKGQQLFKGDSSTLKDSANHHTCLDPDDLWRSEMGYVVPAPFWEDVCIDSNECYSLRVSAPLKETQQPTTSLKAKIYQRQ